MSGGYTQSARYQRCQALFDRQYPHFEDGGQLYARRVAEALAGRGAALLDVGAGRASLAAASLKAAGVAVGVDLVAADLAANAHVAYAALADAEALPFAAASFDVLISQWVVEHFARPALAFAEMARALRPGGQLVLFTTNAHNYIPLLGRLAPGRLRAAAIDRLLRRPVGESHRTFYRANTGAALERAAAAAGLRLVRCEYVGNPFYLAFAVPLFRLALLFERLTDHPTRRALKLYIVATLEKA